MDIFEFLILLLFSGLPTASLVFFFVSLFRFSYASYRNKHHPSSYSESQIKTRRTLLIVSALTAAVLVGTVIALITLMLMSIAYM